MNNQFRAHKEIPINKPTRYYSNLQETQVANAVGGVKTPNSGATMFQPSDVVTDKFALECKTCTQHKKSFTLKEEWFEKNKSESLDANKEYSAVVFNFGPNTPNYYVIDEMLFNELLIHLNEEDR